LNFVILIIIELIYVNYIHTFRRWLHQIHSTTKQLLCGWNWSLSPLVLCPLLHLSVSLSM